MKRHFKWLKFFGIGLWLFIISRLDFQRVLEVLKEVNFLWLSIAGILLCGMFVFKSLRWRTALRAQGISYSLSKTLDVILASWFFGLLTPGRLGDLSKVIYLRETGVTLSEGLASVILDRLYDLVLLLIFGTAGLFFFIEIFSVQMRLFFMFAGATGIILALLYSLRQGFRFRGKDILKIIMPQSLYARVQAEWNAFRVQFKRIALTTLFPMLFFSLLGYACFFAQMYAIAVGLGLSISFLYLSLCFSLAGFVSLLPISVAGLGTREAILIVLFQKVSLPAESAVLMSFIDMTIFSVVLPLILAVVFAAMRKT